MRNVLHISVGRGQNLREGWVSYEARKIAHSFVNELLNIFSNVLRYCSKFAVTKLSIVNRQVIAKTRRFSLN